MASIVSVDRIVFNIKGNDYRLVVAVDFDKSIVWIKWLGSHKDYDRIDVKKVRHGRCGEADSIEARPCGGPQGGRAVVGRSVGSRDGDRLDVLVTLIEAYEEEHYPIDPPDPIDAIKFRMEQQGLTRRDLEEIIGARTRVAEVLNWKRGLSIWMIRRLNERLGISAEVLIPASRKTAA
jgi:HTH-type transcriptional regulator/antitoxin HigA